MRSCPPTEKHLAEKGVESWTSSKVLLCDLGHLVLGNCPQGLANDFAAHQGTASPANKRLLFGPFLRLSLGGLTSLLQALWIGSSHDKFPPHDAPVPCDVETFDTVMSEEWEEKGP